MTKKRSTRSASRSNGAAGQPLALPDPPGVTVPIEVLDEPTRTARRKLTTAEIVAATGLSKQRIGQRRARGESASEIVESVRQRKAAERRALAEEHAHRTRTGGTTPPPLAYSTRRKVEADASLRQLELAVRRGELIPVAQANNWMAGAIMACRNIWMGISDLAARVRECPDTISAQALIDREIRRGLLELEKFCEKMSRRVAAGDDGGTRD